MIDTIKVRIKTSIANINYHHNIPYAEILSIIMKRIEENNENPATMGDDRLLAYFHRLNYPKNKERINVGLSRSRNDDGYWRSCLSKWLLWPFRQRR